MKKLLLFLLIFCFILNPTIAYAESYSQVLKPDIYKCQDIIKQQKLYSTLNSSIQGIFKDETKIDFSKIVDQEWENLKFDSVIDSQIENAVKEVDQNAGLINKFKSSWIPSDAKELGKEVINRAFSSPNFNNKINELSNNVAKGISNSIEEAYKKSSSYGILCLQTFIKNKYSQVFVDKFFREIKASKYFSTEISTSIDPNEIQNILGEHNLAIAGGVLLGSSIVLQINREIFTKVVSQITNRIFQQIGERLFGRISDFIPVAGQFISIAMVAVDIYKSFSGALPEIEKSLKKPEVKQVIRNQLASKIESNIHGESEQIADKISSDIFGLWSQFQKNYYKTLNLAEKLPEFRRIMSEYDISKVSLLVSASLQSMDSDRLIQFIQDGKFEQALALPEASYKIIETIPEFSVLIDWVNLAGNENIEDVVKSELYKYLSPQDIDHQILKEILSLDQETRSKLLPIKVNYIRILLNIDNSKLNSLAKYLSTDELQKIAKYSTELQKSQADLLIEVLLDEPTLSSKFIHLEANYIRKLLVLPHQDLVSLVASLSIEKLQNLAGYLGELEQPETDLLVKVLVKKPSLMSKLSHIDVNSIRDLLKLTKEKFALLVDKLSEDQLQKAVGYLRVLKQSQINGLVELWLKNPSLISQSLLLDINSLSSLLILSQQNQVSLLTHLSVSQLDQSANYLNQLQMKEEEVSLFIKALVKNPSLLSKLSYIDINSIRDLLKLTKKKFALLVDKLSEDQLQKAVEYLRALNQSQANELVELWLENPSLIENTNIMYDIIHSRDVKSATSFWEKESISIFLVIEGMLKALTGAIYWRLFTDKLGIEAGITLICLCILAICFLLLIIRIFFSLLKTNQRKESLR